MPPNGRLNVTAIFFLEGVTSFVVCSVEVRVGLSKIAVGDTSTASDEVVSSTTDDEATASFQVSVIGLTRTRTLGLALKASKLDLSGSLMTTAELISLTGFLV